MHQSISLLIENLITIIPKIGYSNKTDKNKRVGYNRVEGGRDNMRTKE